MILEILSSLTAIDIVILLVMAVGLFTGIYKGVIRQAFALGGLIAGLVLGNPFKGRNKYLSLLVPSSSPKEGR